METATEFLLRWHYLGLFLVLLVEEGGVPLPVPGDLFIAAMGVLAYQGLASFWPTAAIVTAATVLGAGFLFLVSRRLGRPLLLRIARRFGYTEAREARVEGWVQGQGPFAIVVGRLIPGLRIVLTVAAGALRVDGRVFAIGTTMAGVVWATLYFWLGWLLAKGYRTLGPGAGAWPLLAGLVVAGLGLLAWRLARSRRGQEDEPTPR
ncbi:MAG: DedA family protein [Anaeromyxobacteraceae bacterium]